MRSKEVVLAVMVKGQRTDLVHVWAYQTLTTLKVMLRATRHGFRCGDRHGKPCRREESDRVQRVWRPTLTESSGGLGGHGRTRSRRKQEKEKACTSPSVHRAFGNTEFAKQHENGGFDKQQTEKQQKNLENIDIQMSTRLLRRKTLTSIQKGQRAILAGAVQTCARMWARGTVVTLLCPACGHENEDLAHFWWNCKADHSAHIKEKVPQNTTVEAMHPAYRDMMLAQKDTQLLDWE